MDPWLFRLYSFSHYVKVSITQYISHFETNLAQYIFWSDAKLFGSPCLGWEHVVYV